jgi:hypothetical protein
MKLDPLSFSPSIEPGMKLDPARSFLEPGEISLQPITLELAASSPDRPEVTRASRASSQGFVCSNGPAQ